MKITFYGKKKKAKRVIATKKQKQLQSVLIKSKGVNRMSVNNKSFRKFSVQGRLVQERKVKP